MNSHCAPVTPICRDVHADTWRNSRAGGKVADLRDDMILQAAADARKISDGSDAVAGEVLLWADSRQHQHMRRIIGAAAEDDLTLGLDAVVSPPPI